MNIYSTIRIGDYHQNNCEDHLYINEYGKNMILCAVMDGCTTALESHFASTLVGKILKKICIEKGYKDFVDPESLDDIDESLRSILKNLLVELKNIKNALMLDTKELLTTMLIMLINKKSEEGIILAIGDGFAIVNGKKYEFDQDNKPDYLGFHLSEDFEKLYDSLEQKIKFNKVHDISIATDGIFTFEKLKPAKSEEVIDTIDFLTIENTDQGKGEMLHIKLKKLEHNYGLVPTDDLSIVRIIKTE
ncbi:protein phosphatase 2C domain-containing protein [Flavobacterium sp. Fl-318]|uniref:Protein phosphatase 2C domain-containing protein n=1 Tax=Flavobacterium cupriresistens TaxID=2893885 RepID=A0ABU4R875_9FLAO|nr:MULTISPECIES: protein phosphatase 2C domain-containing protein [unclassified Flavobacterium]MDX6188789.1 protein phosphatase 2C domain-containing protein [Flavobacterium sp. Fl-318]UFH44425.1 protein phosphatase 2C domain-containing protein [Flavobacterium sp. F-323]